MRRLLIGDKKVRVRDEGEGSRAPVVLVHGAAGSSVAWMDVVRRLAGGPRRVIAPDLPGHGQSDPWHDVSIDLYRDAVGTICAQLGVKRAVIVGHSLGGAVALRLALGYPDKVAALVLVGTGARLDVDPALPRALEEDPARFGELYRRLAFSPATPVDVVDRWMAVAVQAAPEIAAADFRAADGFDVRDRLGELRLPTVVVAGEDDLLVSPRRARELAAGIAHARLVMVPHAGHFVAQERPEDFHAALAGLLAEVA